MSLEPTVEQQRIVDAALSGENLIIDARAGSGKTSTLQLVAERLKRRTLYLAYNKTMAVDAEGRFPPFVSVMTTHALAYRAVGKDLRHKLARPKGEYVNVRGTGREIASHFKLKDLWVGGREAKTKISSLAVGYGVLSTVRHFENSADAGIGVQHVSMSELTARGIDPQVTDCEAWVKTVLVTAKKFWAERIDPKNDCLAEHDTYLKLYQLSKPRLDYDLVLLDEAQDTNACVLDIILNQVERSQIVLVGDKFQAIYQFRGSLNAMELLPWRSLELTQSFRFGPELAECARNTVLDAETLQPVLNLVGNPGKTTRVHQSDSGLPKAAHIYRTNSALLVNAIQFVERGFSVSISIDTRQFQRKLASAFALFKDNRREIKHPDILLFESWDEFVEDGNQQNPEHLHMARIIQTGRYYRVIKFLANYSVPVDPEFVFITAHKSKGLEWDNVVLGDDFQSLVEEGGKWRYVSEGERNLLYVAVTRARRNIVVNTAVRTALQVVAGAASAATLGDAWPVFDELLMQAEAELREVQHA